MFEVRGFAPRGDGVGGFGTAGDEDGAGEDGFSSAAGFAGSPETLSSGFFASGTFETSSETVAEGEVTALSLSADVNND